MHVSSRVTTERTNDDRNNNDGRIYCYYLPMAFSTFSGLEGASVWRKMEEEEASGKTSSRRRLKV